MPWSHSLPTDRWLAKQGRNGRSVLICWQVTGRSLVSWPTFAWGWQGEVVFRKSQKPCVTEPIDSSHYQVCGKSFPCHQRSLWGWSDSRNTKVIVWLVDVGQTSQRPCANLILTNFLFASHGVIAKSLRLNSVNTKLVGGQTQPTTKNMPSQ